MFNIGFMLKLGKFIQICFLLFYVERIKFMVICSVLMPNSERLILNQQEDYKATGDVETKIDRNKDILIF